MIKKGGVHTTPKDLQRILVSTPGAQTTWKAITPLARNEWICWIISAKKQETRNKRIERARADLIKGKRRPCCFAGCPHR